jgi:hypothetical protein
MVGSQARSVKISRVVLGRGPTVQAHVEVNISQILALLGREVFCLAAADELVRLRQQFALHWPGIPDPGAMKWCN